MENQTNNVSHLAGKFGLQSKLLYGLGLFAAWLLAASFGRNYSHLPWIPFGILFGVIFGAVSTFVEWLIIRRHFTFTTLLWWLISVIAWMSGWLITWGMILYRTRLGSLMYSNAIYWATSGINVRPPDLLYLLTGWMFGAAVCGITQWLVIRKKIQGSIKILLSKLVGGITIFLFLYLLLNTLPYRDSSGYGSGWPIVILISNIIFAILVMNAYSSVLQKQTATEMPNITDVFGVSTVSSDESE